MSEGRRGRLGVVSGGGGGVVAGGGGLGVDSGALIGHIGDIAVISVGGVFDVLDPAVGKGNRVSSGDVAGTIGLLLSVEGGLGVVISDGVGEGVGGDLIGAGLGLVSGGRGVIGGGGVDNRGVISGGGVDNRGVISGGGVDGVSNDGGVDGVGDSVVGDSMVGERGVDGVNTVGNNSISSVKSVGGISHDGGVGSEGLALGGGPVLSLVGLAHGLVAHLAVSVSVDWPVGAIVDGGD